MSALVEIELSYGAMFTAEQVQILEEASVVKLEFADPGEDGRRRLEWNKKPIITLDALKQLGDGLSVQSIRVIDNTSTQSLIAFAQRNTTVVNQKCSVAVPGLGLLLIDEVRLEEDCCTDTLSRLLEGGWRIVAVCVQPDQRRPDYVLGRSGMVPNGR